MRVPVAALIFLASFLHAEPIRTSDVPSTTPASFNETFELEKIAATCLTCREYEKLADNQLRYLNSLFLVNQLMLQCPAIIGLSELRKELGFGPMHPWKPWNRTEPSEGELAAAPTVEAYYDLKEPTNIERSLDSFYLLESNVETAMPYIEEKFPAIRKIFKRRFEKLHEKYPGKEVDRTMVDQFIEEFEEIFQKIYISSEPLSSDCV